MRIKAFFTIPEGKKVTEKVFGRVLLSSICSILLCMICLAGTTWAWFEVTISGNGGQIQIVDVEMTATVKNGSETLTPAEDGSYTLEKGTYTVSAQLEGERTNTDIPVYALVSVGDDHYCMQLENSSEGTGATRDLLITAETANVRISLVWLKPDGAQLVENGGTIGAVKEDPATQPSTGATEGTTEGTTETTGATEPSDAIEPSGTPDSSTPTGENTSTGEQGTESTDITQQSAGTQAEAA